MLNHRHHILLVLSGYISSWEISSNHILSRYAKCHFFWGFPNHLCEMTRVLREYAFRMIIVLDLTVPYLSCIIWVPTEKIFASTFSVLWFAMQELFNLVQVFRPFLSLFLHLPIYFQIWHSMKCPFLIMCIQLFQIKISYLFLLFSHLHFYRRCWWVSS